MLRFLESSGHLAQISTTLCITLPKPCSEAPRSHLSCIML